MAHRGASAHAPEHTFEAYDLALEMGADALELDVRATADGRLVVLHDPTLARTTGDPRHIVDVRAAQLGGLGRPLALERVLERYGAGPGWLIELKDPTPAQETALVDVLRRHAPAATVTVQSFDHRALRRVRRLAPELAVAPLFSESLTGGEVRARLARAGRYACAVGVAAHAVDAALVQAAHARGLWLRAYTVNDPREMSRLLALGVDGLITDVPGQARAAVRDAFAVRTAAA